MQSISHDIEIAASPAGNSFSFQTTPELADNSTIGRDLQNAIDQLRAIPSINIWELRSIQRHTCVSENQLQRTTLDDVRRRRVVTSETTTTTTVDENNDVINNDASRINDVTETDSAADESTDDRSKYSMSWNIRRLRKHRLDPTGYRKSRGNSVTTTGSPPYGGDFVRKTSRERGLSSTSYEAGSDESLDSVVERILESTDDVVFEDAKRYRVPSEPEIDALPKTETGIVDAVDLTLDVNRRHVVVTCDDERVKNTGDSLEASAPAPVHCVSHSTRPCSKRNRQSEVSLEELFEEAVELLDSCDESNDRDVGDVLIPTKSTATEAADAGRRYRGEDNLERRIYDDELHQHCHQYRLHGYSVVSDPQYSRISRGFALVEKVDKVSSPLTSRRHPVDGGGGGGGGGASDVARREKTFGQPDGRNTWADDVLASPKHDDKWAVDADGRTTFRQRTVISASLAPSGGQRRINEDGTQDYIRKMNLDLDCELATKVEVGNASQPTGMSRSSSITWDTISVDSLVMMDDDTSTVRAIYSATTLNTSAANPLPAIEDNMADAEAPRSASSAYDVESRIAAVLTETDGLQKRQLQSVYEDNTPVPSGVALSSLKTSRIRSKADVGYNQSTSAMTSSNATIVEPRFDDVIVLADSVTTQTLVLNVKLPKSLRHKSRMRPKSAPCHRLPGSVPFRDLRVHREIQLADIHRTNVATTNVTSVTSSSAVDGENIENDASTNDVITTSTTGDDSVIVFNSLRPSDLMTSLPIDAEVKYENRQMTSGTDIVPDGGTVDADGMQLVGVERTEAVRELVVRGRQSTDFRFEPMSLRRLVDNVKEALAAGGAVMSLGCAAVGITCEAVETRSLNSCTTAPTVINDVVFDSMTSSMTT